MRRCDMLTQAEVKKVFDYEPETGLCTWKVHRLKAAPGDPIDERYRYKDGYLVISLKGKAHLVHRLVWLWMTGEWPEQSVTHVNGDRSDNRWENLKMVSISELRSGKRGPRRKKGKVATVAPLPDWLVGGLQSEDGGVDGN